jgi:hypothetical protein
LDEKTVPKITCFETGAVIIESLWSAWFVSHLIMIMVPDRRRRKDRTILFLTVGCVCVRAWPYHRITPKWLGQWSPNFYGRFRVKMCNDWC